MIKKTRHLWPGFICVSGTASHVTMVVETWPYCSQVLPVLFALLAWSGLPVVEYAIWASRIGIYHHLPSKDCQRNLNDLVIRWEAACKQVKGHIHSVSYVLLPESVSSPEKMFRVANTCLQMAWAFRTSGLDLLMFAPSSWILINLTYNPTPQETWTRSHSFASNCLVDVLVFSF